MNQLYKNVMFLATGAFIGGLSGYFIADMIIKHQQEAGLPEDAWIPEDAELRKEAEEAVKGPGKPVAYTEFSKEKGDLTKLAEQYAHKEKEIRIVHAEEVINSNGRHFVEVKYYDGDNVYALENDSTIDAPQEIFVPNAHLHFGEFKDEDPDILYIRNDKNGTDYEITRVHAKYSVVVLGEEDTAKKARSPRRSRASKAKEVTDATK